MFTELVRDSCDFLTCPGLSTAFQTCLIIHQPSTALDPDPGSGNVETVLSCLSTSCRSHFCSSLYCNCLVSNHFSVMSVSSIQTSLHDRL